MKEIDLTKPVKGKLSIAEITTFEEGILLVYKYNDVIGYIAFENYDSPKWSFYDCINTTAVHEQASLLYSLIDILIKEYNITNIKLLEFNQK